jgi:hypothetical protein
MKSLVDTDILLKGSAYGLLEELVAIVPGEGRSALLGAAKFVVPTLINRAVLNKTASVVSGTFQRFIEANEVVEPTEEEQQLSATLESLAQTEAVSLDTGESQLVAILITRGVPFLLTGDKRAIAAMERLIQRDPAFDALTHRVKCLEQLVRDLIRVCNFAEIRAMICAEPSVDKTLNICLACGSPDVSLQTICQGLESYIADLRHRAGTVLSS